MRNVSLLTLYLILLLPSLVYSQSLGNAEFKCLLDTSTLSQSQAKIPCTSLISLVNNNNPQTEYLKHFPDQYTPIKTVNLRLVFFHKDSTRIHNFRSDNGVHLAYFRRAIDSANSRLSALLGNADSFNCRSEPNSNEYVNLFGFHPDSLPQVVKWTPDGNALTQITDSRLRFRIHDAIDIISPTTWEDGSSTVYENHATQNNIPNDALIVMIPGDQHDYDLWNNPSTYDPDTNDWEGGPWYVSNHVSTNYNERLYFWTSDVFNKYRAMQTGFFCLTSPNNFQCCDSLGNPDTVNGCPDIWLINDIAKGFLHEIGHDLGLGHSNQCYANIQNNNGGSSRRTWYDLQLGQANRVMKNSNARNVVNECWPASIDRPITGNVTYDENQRIFQNLVIKSGATLTVTCELHMPNIGVIIVEPGGKLIVDGGKITNINNDHCGKGYWRGIEVLGTPGLPQNATNCGIVEIINGGTIEFANNAVKNYHVPTSGPNEDIPEQHGGIIRANNAIFKNNFIADVQMANYQNFLVSNPAILLPDMSYFRNSQFIIDDEFWETTDTSVNVGWFINLKNVNGIGIYGCDFVNNSTSARPELYGGGGIVSENASYNVSPLSTHANAKRSSFKNLRWGIYATGTGSMRSISVDKTDFEIINFPIWLSGVNNASITRNEFAMGQTQIYGIATAISTFNSSGYHIEGNYITQDPSMEYPTYGIRIYNSGTASNEVYRNTVTKMQIGIVGQVINRASNIPNQGLEFKCDSMYSNGFDFVVSPSNSSSFPASVQGIKATQGASNLSAGNAFDPLGSEAESHYKVAVSNTVDYYGHVGNGKPDLQNKVTQGLFIYLGDKQRSCQSSFQEPGGGNPVDTIANIEMHRLINNNEYAVLDTVYANLFYNRSQLVDGGSTPQLLTTIQDSWTQDAWNLRNELLANSPLSEETFLEAANTGILPDALLLEVALANPDATRSAELISILQYDIPNPLDQNAINLIVANWEQETPLGILEAEMGAVQGRMEVLNNRLLRSFLFDPYGYVSDSIEYYMTRNMGHSKHMAYINWLADQERFSDAEQELYDLSNSLPEGEYWMDEFNRFEAFVDQKIDWLQADISLNALDSSHKTILDAWAEVDDITGAMAKNLLFINFGEEFYLPAIELGESGKVGTTLTFKKEQLFSAKVYPNPAESYVSFTFKGTMGEDILLSLMDASGREIKQVNIKAKAPVKTISTEGLPSGQYYYKAISGEQVITGKLSIAK